MGWEGVKSTLRYKYLGVQIGTDPEFSVRDVYAEAVGKLRRRVADLKTKWRHIHLNLGNRVRMANTYLVPIFSYLMRFYLMDETSLEEATKLLEEWCIRKPTTLFRLVAPTADAGLDQPLKDLRFLNVAIMLRGTTSHFPGLVGA